MRPNRIGAHDSHAEHIVAQNLADESCASSAKRSQFRSLDGPTVDPPALLPTDRETEKLGYDIESRTR